MYNRNANSADTVYPITESATKYSNGDGYGYSNGNGNGNGYGRVIL